MDDTVGNVDLLQLRTAPERLVPDSGDAVRNADLRQPRTPPECLVPDAGDPVGDGRSVASENQFVRLRLDDCIAVRPGIVFLVRRGYCKGQDSGTTLECACLNVADPFRDVDFPQP